MPWTKSICPSRVFPDSWKQIIFGRHLLHIYTFSLVLDIVSTLGFLTWSAVLIIGKASNPSRRIQVTAIFGVSSVFMILANVVYIFLGLNNIIFTGFTLGLFVLFGFLLVSKLSGTTEKLAPLPVSVTSVHPGEVDIHQIIIGPDYKQSAPQQQYNQKVYQPAMVPRQTVLQNPYLTVGYYQNQQQQQRQSCSCHQHQCGQSIYPDPPVPQYEGFEIIPHPSSHISAPIPIPKPAQAPPEYTPGAGLYGEPKCHGK